MGGTDETGFGAAKNGKASGGSGDDVVAFVAVLVGGLVLVLVLIGAYKKRNQMLDIASRDPHGVQRNQPRKGTREYLAFKATNKKQSQFKIKTGEKFSRLRGKPNYNWK